jgi:lipid-binding SYLF domain-containing protein
MKHALFIIALALAFAIPAQAQAANRDQQRTEIQRMKADVLDKLYRAEPQAQRQISKAAGYAVFSSADVAAIFVSGSLGHGVAHNNSNKDETYMQMASAGVGLGLGVKDFKTVFIFGDKKAYHDFVTTGLDLSGNVDVAVKGGQNGGAVTGAVEVMPSVRVYQMTESGLLAQVMLKGTKYWRDDDLNNYDQTSAIETRTTTYNQ